MRLIISLLLASLISLSAQETAGKITGTITDAQTNQPIENVNIYIANSLIGTSTNERGEFLFPKVAPGRYTIIFSHLSYLNKSEKVEIFSDRNVILNFSLTPKPIEFPEIDVSDKYDDDWWDNFEIFSEELLGNTWFAGGCEITNPYYINFFENDDGVLFASSDVPIQIENRSLGYNIKYILKHFEYKLGVLKYAGYPVFEEMHSEFQEDSLIWRENRLEAYMGSLRHFLRAISEFYTLITEGEEQLKITLDYDNVTEDGTSFTYDQDMFLSRQGFAVFLIKKNSIARLFEVESVIDSSHNPNELYFNCDDKIEIQYSKEYEELTYNTQLSFIKLHADSVYFDKRGRYWDEFKIETQGYMSKQRLAEMLPFEYEPSDSVLINTDFR